MATLTPGTVSRTQWKSIREGFAPGKTVDEYWAPLKCDLLGNLIAKSPQLTSRTDIMLYAKFHFIPNYARESKVFPFSNPVLLCSAYLNENSFG
jgi:hypothetical protein